MNSGTCFSFSSLFILVIALLVFTEPKADGSPSATSIYLKDPADLVVADSLYDSGLIASTLSALLSNNSRAAARQLGEDLANRIIILNSQLKYNPCHINSAQLAHIYPMLRVIAAVNHNTPIPGISENKTVQAILAKAIDDNHEHYEALIQRSSHWNEGIN
jgi:hypothetical protein